MKPRWIDTHNHLFVLPHEQQKAEVTDARACGVAAGLVCAGGTDNFEAAIRCAHEWDSCYALALHPLYLRESWRSDLQVLEDALLKIERIRVLRRWASAVWTFPMTVPCLGIFRKRFSPSI